MSTITLATSRGEGDNPAKDSECSSPLAAATTCASRTSNKKIFGSFHVLFPGSIGTAVR